MVELPDTRSPGSWAAPSRPPCAPPHAAECLARSPDTPLTPRLPHAGRRRRRVGRYPVFRRYRSADPCFLLAWHVSVRLPSGGSTLRKFGRSGCFVCRGKRDRMAGRRSTMIAASATRLRRPFRRGCAGRDPSVSPKCKGLVLSFAGQWIPAFESVSELSIQSVTRARNRERTTSLPSPPTSSRRRPGPILQKNRNRFSVIESSHCVVVKRVTSMHPRIDRRMDPGLQAGMTMV